MKVLIINTALIFFLGKIAASDTLNVKNFGAKGDGKTDDTKAIQSALNASSPLTKTTIYFPAGIYNIASYTTTPVYFINYCLILHSNLDIEGEGDQSIIRLADHIFDQTDTSANAHLFYGSHIKNINFSNLVIDLNGANNLVPSNVLKNHAAIFTADGYNYYIHNVTIKNCSGTNMLNIMRPGRGLVIENCTLLNGGNYVGNAVANKNQIDFSFIYSEWDSTIVTNNNIRQQNIDIALSNYTGGVELHGSNSSATDNYIEGCWPAIYITSSGDSVLNNVSIENNRIINCVTGISFWIEHPMHNVLIEKNQIQLTSSRSPKLKICAGIHVPNGNSKEFSKRMANAAPIYNLQIKENTITADTMEMLSAAMILHSLQGSSIQNNIITGMNYGGIVLAGSKWGIDSLLVTNNTFHDFLPNNDKNAVAGYIVITDTYSKDINNAPGFKEVEFSNNKFLRSKMRNTASNMGKGKFLGGFIAVPEKMAGNIIFKNNKFSDPSEKISTVKID